MFTAARRSRRLGLWGHGKAYTEGPSWLRDSVKKTFTKRADWFFAYTRSGASAVQEYGFPSSRVTTLRNATDTRRLRDDIQSVRPSEVSQFEEEHSLVPGRSALFLGGLDERKGLPFLFRAARFASNLDPNFRLVVAGEGRSRPIVHQQEREGAPIKHVGRLTGRRKAIAMRAARVLAIPEWVGLVAVDSFAAGLPIASTIFENHAPEFDYLENNFNALIVPHDSDAYGAALVRLLRDSELRGQLEEGCIQSLRGLSIEEMASRFVSGIEDWRKSPKVTSRGRGKE